MSTSIVVATETSTHNHLRYSVAMCKTIIEWIVL